MNKSPTLKIANFSDHKNLLRIRSQRAKQRESIINHKRQLFTTGNTSEEPCHHHVTKSSLKILRKNAPISEEDFSQFVHQLDLECNSLQSVVKTTKRIKKMLTIEVNPPIDKFIRSGAVPYLVQLLDTKEIEKYYMVNEQDASVHRRSKTSITKRQLFQLQFFACWVITNIVSGTSDHTRYIVELGCVPLLVQLLSSKVDPLKEQAVWAIGNIAGDSVLLRNYVLELGATDQIVESMQEKRYNLSLQKNAVWTVSNLLRGKPIPQWDLISSAIPLLCDLILQSHDKEVLADTCWSFTDVIDGFSQAIPEMVKRGAVKKLVELLTSSEQEIQAPAVRSIVNLAKGNDEVTQLLISYGMLNQFTTLLNHPKKSIRTEVMWSISNIAAGNKEQIQAVIDANLFPKLMETISSENEVSLKWEAFWAFTNALEGGSPIQVQYLIDLGTVTVFCDSLTSHDLQTVLLVLQSLEAILKYATLNDSLNKVLTSIESCGGLNKVKSLKEHSNDEIVSAALKVLNFIEEENDSTEK